LEAHLSNAGGYSVKAMFLDESGNHGLTTIDHQYPVFVLGGIIVDLDYARSTLEARIQTFKSDFFGRDDLILHTADITRNKNGFEGLKDDAFRKRFYEELNNLMRELEYTVVACVIKKDEHLSRYGIAALDPYLLSLDLLVERFCFEIGDIENGGIIYAEKRSPVLDRQLDIAWLNLKIQGTRYVKAVDVNKRISDLRSRGKSENIAGLQLADLVVTPIGRHVIGKSRHQDWEIVESKLRRRNGRFEGAGLVILPDKNKD
jgi:hypothetical protein